MSLKSKCLMLLASPAGRLLPDGLYLRAKYRLKMGRRLDLRHPRSYNEKLQWLKLHDRNPLYHTLVDKAGVKAHVASLIGEEYTVPTLGVWDKPVDIDWNSLPQRFVLKCTHDSGSAILCRDKAAFDIPAACRSLAAALKKDFYPFDREWAYKGLKPRIIAEAYLGDNVPDYKFFCFDGRPRLMFIASERGRRDTETRFDFYDMEGRHLDLRNGHPNADTPPALPQRFELMQTLAARLSAGLPQVRIDFYELDGKVYFGEYTFYHWGGMVPFEPESFDLELGSYVKLEGIK